MLICCFFDIAWTSNSWIFTINSSKSNTVRCGTSISIIYCQCNRIRMASTIACYCCLAWIIFVLRYIRAPSVSIWRSCSTYGRSKFVITASNWACIVSWCADSCYSQIVRNDNLYSLAIGMVTTICYSYCYVLCCRNYSSSSRTLSNLQCCCCTAIINSSQTCYIRNFVSTI